MYYTYNENNLVTSKCASKKKNGLKGKEFIIFIEKKSVFLFLLLVRFTCLLFYTGLKYN